MSNLRLLLLLAFIFPEVNSSLYKTGSGHCRLVEHLQDNLVGLVGMWNQVSWPQPGAGMSKTLSRRIVSRQNGLVLTVGRVPGLHVQALSLCNSCGVSLFHLLTFILYQASCINCMLCVTNMFNMQVVYWQW